MDSASYISATAMKAAYRALEVATNNLSNLNSPGFKADKPFYRILNEEADRLSGSAVMGTSTDFSVGPIRRTGAQLDVAIKGQGFFAVQTPAGIQYTRNGSFTIGQGGELVTMQGHPVLDQNNQQVYIATGPSPIEKITINQDGEIIIDNFVSSRIGVFSFDDPAGLRKEGDLHFTTDQPPQPVVNPELQQGALEESNVNAVSAMLELIELQRMFDFSYKSVSTTMNDINRQAISTIAS